MIITGKDLISYYKGEKLYSTGDSELDELLERAFCEGYEYAQREFAGKSDPSLNFMKTKGNKKQNKSAQRELVKNLGGARKKEESDIIRRYISGDKTIIPQRADVAKRIQGSNSVKLGRRLLPKHILEQTKGTDRTRDIDLQIGFNELGKKK